MRNQKIKQHKELQIVKSSLEAKSREVVNLLAELDKYRSLKDNLIEILLPKIQELVEEEVDVRLTDLQVTINSTR